jgi:predicted nucleotidyltransferase
MVLPCEDPESGIRVDFILSHSPYERGALERVRTVRMGQAQVRFASIEDLIIHKMVAGRPRDLEDVASLVRKNHTMDHGYLERWLEQFSTTLHEPLLERWKNLLKETT